MSAEIKPYRISIGDDALDDLRSRLRNTRWPEAELVDDWSQGAPLLWIREICRYWAEEYDWRQREARLNRFAQYATEIDGLDIHFLHVRSPHPDAMPLIITHGWPGSIVEFHKVIEPLTDPTAQGGNAADAFHVVCPSLPGFGFSAKPKTTGWGVDRIASAWAVLMDRLGYTRYGAQGGDWGSAITTAIGAQDSAHCAGIHITLAMSARPNVEGQPTVEEARALSGIKYYADWDSGYSKQQSTRPQTLGYALTDSPSGQAAWILEKFWAWTDCEGHLRNHGLLVVGRTVPAAFNVLFRLERACQVQVMALSCNTKLIYPPQEILEDTYERMQPKPGRGARNGDLAWPALLRKLDRADPSYRN